MLNGKKIVVLLVYNAAETLILTVAEISLGYVRPKHF